MSLAGHFLHFPSPSRHQHRAVQVVVALGSKHRDHSPPLGRSLSGRSVVGSGTSVGPGAVEFQLGASAIGTEVSTVKANAYPEGQGYALLRGAERYRQLLAPELPDEPELHEQLEQSS